MSLPELALPSSTVDIGGVQVAIRSLTRSEAYRVKELVADEDVAETYVIACGTDSTEAEAKAWRSATAFDAVTPLVNAILALSGLRDADDPKG